jgi:hypothetical protein
MKIVTFVLGLAVGYVVGTRQGRQGYEKLKDRARDLWSNPRVQRTVSDAQKVVKDKVPGLGGVASQVVDTIDDAAAVPSTGGYQAAPGNV